jgi:hypothetical protein
MSLALLLLHSAFNGPARACAVCFGKSDQVGLVTGITIGIFTLMGLTFAMIGGIFMTVRRIERARAAAEAAL